MAAEQGNYEKAEMYDQEGLILARQSGYRERICALLANLGDIVCERGNYKRAEEYFKEGLLLAREIEHREWTSVLLCNLGLATRKQGNYAQAEEYLKAGLVLARQIGIPQITANILYEYGNLCVNQRRIKDAEAHFDEMLTITPEESQDLIALAKYGLAQTAVEQNNNSEAVLLGTASMAALEKMGNRKAEEVKQWFASIKV